MTKEALLAFFQKTDVKNNWREALVTKTGDFIEIIDEDYKLKEDYIIIKQAKSHMYGRLLHDTRISYINIDYLTFISSLYV